VPGGTINKGEKHTTYPQPDTKIPAFAPGQNSVGADNLTATSAAGGRLDDFQLEGLKIADLSQCA
jgi:hypothetical protein